MPARDPGWLTSKHKYAQPSVADVAHMLACCVLTNSLQDSFDTLMNFYQICSDVYGAWYVRVLKWPDRAICVPNVTTWIQLNLMCATSCLQKCVVKSWVPMDAFRPLDKRTHGHIFWWLGMTTTLKHVHLSFIVNDLTLVTALGASRISTWTPKLLLRSDHVNRSNVVKNTCIHHACHTHDTYTCPCVSKQLSQLLRR